MKSTLIAIVVIVLVVVVGVGGFFAGNSFGSNAQALSTVNQFRTRRAGTGAPGGAPSGQGTPGGTQGRRPVAFGTVKSVQGNTIQVTAQDGTLTTVTTDSKTVVLKTVTGAMTDIQPGERVTVMGSQSGNDVTATDISVQPSGQGGQ